MVGGRHAGPAAIAHAVDLNLTNAEESTVKYAAHGGLALFWPRGQAEIHRPYATGFDFDVSFVGACYGWRPASSSGSVGSGCGSNASARLAQRCVDG